MDRPSKEGYYLNIALETSKRSTCNRRHFGAIIVKDDSIISCGYNGPVRGAPNCLKYECLKNKNNKEAGKGYDSCRAGPMHAEVNAIVNAARNNGGLLVLPFILLENILETEQDFLIHNPARDVKKQLLILELKKL